MKRILPFLFAIPLCAFACSHKSSSSDGNGGNGPGGNGSSGGGDNGSSGSSGNVDLTKNPIEGIAPAQVVVDIGDYTDGPIWHAGQQVIFFTTPLGAGALYRMREDGSTLQVRAGDSTIGAVPIGNTVSKNGDLVTFEAKRIVRGSASPDAGAPTEVASSYPGEGGPAPFDTLKSGVMRPDGTMYVTDPGYFGTPVANRIYRITPQGQVAIVEAFEDVPRPNGIALSPDQKALYVGFSAPGQGTLPFVRKYYVNDDGTLGEQKKLADMDPPDSQPDGIEVDQAGNLYVACKQGIVVMKSDGSKIGVIPLPDIPTGMAFAGKDMMTIYVTTSATKIYSLRVNVPGIAQ
jgi:gluconolactonase